MRPLALALLFALAGCYVPVYETRPAPPPPPQLIPERQAVAIAFDAARARGLEVDRVQRARLDAHGRWHVVLAGRDHAELLIDGPTGRLLKGRFHEAGPPPGDAPPPPAQSEWED